MPQLLLTNSPWSIDLVAENQKRNFGKLLNGQKGVELGFRFGESLKVCAVDEKNDTINFGEVVAPEASG
jgi:hypothetical protein